MQLTYGLPGRTLPVWTPNLVANGDSHDVHLLRDGAAVAVLCLDEFAALSATRFVVRDAVEAAEGLAVYGSNIEEADKYIAAEFGVYDEEDEVGPVPEPRETRRKR